MRIAVCDDESTHREMVIKSLYQNRELLPEFTIDEYSSGENLLEHIDQIDQVELIFMDVEMAGIDGIETAKKITEEGIEATFVFLTSHDQYVFRSFEVQPFDYLIKPLQIKQFKKTLDRFMRHYRKNLIKVDVVRQDSVVAVRISDIIYIENNKRHTNLVLKNEILKSDKSLSYYANQLNNSGFISCHRGILVNLKYIRSINKNSITTTKNQELYLSARKRQECLAEFNAYLVERAL